MKTEVNPLNILDTPEIVKVEKRYQVIRTLLNAVAIVLMTIALVRLYNIGTQIQNSITQGRESRDTQLKTIQSNQNTLLCIVRESTNPTHTKISIVNGEFKYTVDNSYIDKCVKDNK